MLSHWAYQCTSIFRRGSTLASECDWLQSPPIPYTILLSFCLPFRLLSSCSVSGATISLSFRREEVQRGRGKGEFPQSRAKDKKGRRHRSPHFHSAPGPMRSQLHVGVQSVHSCQSSASEQRNYQFSTISTRTPQWYRSPFLPPSFPSQATWNNNNKLQTLAQCIITYKYRHPANEIHLLSEPADPRLL